MENFNMIIKGTTLLGNIAGKVFDDGKITAADIMVLPDFMSVGTVLANVNYGAIGAEFKEFGAESVNGIVETITTNLNIPQKNIEKTVKTCVVAAGTIVGAAFTIISIFKAPKA